MVDGRSLMRAVCLEPREDLAYSYFDALQKHLPYRREILTVPKISSLLELVAGKKEAMELERQLQVLHRTQISESGNEQSPGLLTQSLIKTGNEKWRFWNIKLLLQLLGLIDVYACLISRFMGFADIPSCSPSVKTKISHSSHVVY
jgi:hypothetical protein